MRYLLAVLMLVTAGCEVKSTRPVDPLMTQEVITFGRRYRRIEDVKNGETVCGSILITQTGRGYLLKGSEVSPCPAFDVGWDVITKLDGNYYVRLGSENISFSKVVLHDAVPDWGIPVRIERPQAESGAAR